jgi:hypothetical protein
MEGCPLCAGVRVGPDDEESSVTVTIAHVYDASAYRPLIDSDESQKLLRGCLPSGSAPGVEPIYGELPATNPSDSIEQMSQLENRAVQLAWEQAGPPYLDITVWAHLSAALLWASYLAAAEKAHRSGNQRKATGHEADAATVWADVELASAATMDYLRREAGYARFGNSARYEVGRWEDAHEWVTGMSVQYLAHNTGNPRLHAHNLVLNLVETQRTGEWGRLDIRGLHRFKGAAAAIAAVELERLLTLDLGVYWERRADGHGREIGGISRAQLDAFSSPPQPNPPWEAQRPPIAPGTSEPAQPISLHDELKHTGWL